jgi:hypothetical protein
MVRSFFDDIEYASNVYAHGPAYANLAEKVKELEKRQCNQDTITISFLPVRHYPVRAHRRG